MKKFLPALVVALLIGGATSCGDSNKNANYSLSQISHPTDADSLMYYFGQLRAVKYWRDAATDSLLRTPEGQKEYMEGLRDAMKALNRSEAYLRGLLSGANHAENIASYSRNYGRDFNPDVMVKSMTAALAHDSVSDVDGIRRQFYALRNHMEQMRDERDEAKATAALVIEGNQLGMTRLTSDLWGKILVHGRGEKVERGDRIEVAMQLTTLSGHKIPINLPNEVFVGARLISTVFTDAMISMKFGDRAEFATTALALFGSHAAQMELKPEDILILTISIIGELDGNDPNVSDTGAL